MTNKQDLYNLIDFVLERLRGFDVNVMVQANSEGLTRFANSEINQNVYEDKTTLYVTVSDGKRSIDLVTSSLEKENLEQALRDTVAKLKIMPEKPNPLHLISSPSEITLDHFNGELSSNFDIQKRAQQIKECLNVITDKSYKGFGALSHVEYRMAVGNSEGIRRFHHSNNATFAAFVAKKPGASSGSTRITTNSMDGFDCLSAMQRAYGKAVLNQDPLELTGGKFTVILEPLAVHDLMAFVAAIGFSGRSILDGSSFLCGKFGQKIFSEKLSIIDDWTDSHTIHLPFDMEGSMRQVVPIINKGVATSVVHDFSSASKLGVASTGHAYPAASWGMIPLNLVVSSGEKPLEQLISETENGLLVTRLHYVNPVNRNQGVFTALTKDGLMRISDGKLVGSAKNMRFTASVFDIFSNIIDISSNREKTKWWYPMTSYYMPALKISDFPFVATAKG